MKKEALTLFLSLFFLSVIGAQEFQITGTVTDESGVPLPGVNITVVETSSGTTTDFDGKYAIELEQGNVLKFSSVGFEDQEVTVADGDVVDVVMKTGTALDEVVVTALGIKRKEKSLTSAQQNVTAEEITKTKEPNFLRSLSGKIAGLNIQSSAAGMGGSSKVEMRGTKSLNGVSSPLYVIDGIPMLNNQTGKGDGLYDGYDNGDGLSQINPNDIANITVLKGANSAALYGSQGANGVILIETKSGEPGKLHGSVSSATQFKTINTKPDFQYRYGRENQEGTESWSYEKGDYNDDFIDDFFKTGYQFTNSISISGGAENSLSYLSYANTVAGGTMPKNKYKRNNVTFKQTNKFFNDKLQVTARMMLADEKMRNRPAAGPDFNPLPNLYTFPRDMDFSEYRKHYEVFDKDRNLMTLNWFQNESTNPYWVINRNPSESQTKRLIGNVAISYDFNEKLNVQVRGNYDYSRKKFDQKIWAGTPGAISSENGRYRMKDLTDTKVYSDIMLGYNDNFGDFDLDVYLGASYENTVLGNGIDADSRTDGLKYANIFSLQNFADKALVSQTTEAQLKKQGVFGNISIGYKDMVYLDFSGRNDWSSSLAFTDNSSYFYPSVGGAVLLSEIIDLPEVFSFAKLRTSYAKVSSEVPAFISNPLDKIGKNGVEINTQKPFEELEPEDQYSFELGADFRFLEGRIGLDFTYYKIDNKNLFTPLAAPSGSGYTTFYVNAGHVRNSGFEISLKAKPVKNNDFQWSSMVNFTANKNEILELHEDLQGRYQLSKSEGYAHYVTEGGHFSDIYAYDFQRDDQGRIKVNEDGEPQQTSEEQYFGQAAPDFQMGWNNTFNYKNWNLSFLIDAKIGGKAISGTESVLDRVGVSQRTAQARDRGKVFINAVDPDGNSVNAVDPKSFYRTVGGKDNILGYYVFSATNIRLREIALGYTFQFEDSFFQNVKVSFIANNLFFLYKDAPFDPDVSLSAGNSNVGFDFWTPPSTRTFGINFNVNF